MLLCYYIDVNECAPSVPIPVMRMQSATTLKAATDESVGQDSLEMDTTAQVAWLPTITILFNINIIL